MNLLPRRVRLAVFLRSFAIQGSWNYETLIGTGFAFSLVPVLRVLFAGDQGALRDAIARHSTLFNSHPYLATVAVGAVARLEADGVDPKIIDRFKSAMRGSLGSIGDQLVWCTWRPASALLGIVLVLAGAAWWVALAAFLTVYNGLHLTLRAWGLRIGLESGLQVGKLLREAPLQSISARASDVGSVLCGFAVPLLIAPLGFGAVQMIPVAAAVALGLWFGLGVRRVLAAVVVLAWIVAMLLSWIS